MAADGPFQPTSDFVALSAQLEHFPYAHRAAFIDVRRHAFQDQYDAWYREGVGGRRITEVQRCADLLNYARFLPAEVAVRMLTGNDDFSIEGDQLGAFREGLQVQIEDDKESLVFSESNPTTSLRALKKKSNQGLSRIEAEAGIKFLMPHVLVREQYAGYGPEFVSHVIGLLAGVISAINESGENKTRLDVSYPLLVDQKEGIEMGDYFTEGTFHSFSLVLRALTLKHHDVKELSDGLTIVRQGTQISPYTRSWFDRGGYKSIKGMKF